jgi:hypothetical protein
MEVGYTGTVLTAFTPGRRKTLTTPLEYANQYRSLAVAFDDGPVMVAIENYHEGAWG